jgi:hypothetical protein
MSAREKRTALEALRHMSPAEFLGAVAGAGEKQLRPSAWLRRPSRAAVIACLIALAYLGLDAYLIRHASGGLFWGMLAAFGAPVWYAAACWGDWNSPTTPPAVSDSESFGEDLPDICHDPLYSNLSGNIWHSTQEHE